MTAPSRRKVRSIRRLTADADNPTRFADGGVALPGVADELCNDLPVEVVDTQRFSVLRNGTRLHSVVETRTVSR